MFPPRPLTPPSQVDTRAPESRSPSPFGPNVLIIIIIAHPVDTKARDMLAAHNETEVPVTVPRGVPFPRDARGDPPFATDCVDSLLLISRDPDVSH